MSEPREDLLAYPGWVILQDCGAPDAKSRGGIALPASVFNDPIHLGRVYSCGEYVDKVSGERHGGKNWVKPGTYVFFLCTNPWPIPGVDDISLVAVQSNAIICEVLNVEAEAPRVVTPARGGIVLVQ